jgi:hypothetical protein
MGIFAGDERFSWHVVDNGRSATRIDKENIPMKNYRKLAFLSILLTFLLVLALPGKAYANDNTTTRNTSLNDRELQDQFVFGDTYTLHNGDTLVGDLFILGGTVTLEEGSNVKGNVILVGGSLSIQGNVEKDLVAIGGTPTIDPSGRIKGDAVTIGCQLGGATERVAGDVITDTGGVFRIRLFEGRLPTVGVSRLPILWDFLGLSFSVFFMTTMAIGIVLLLPKQTERTAQVLKQQPVASGGMGCLTMMVAPFILVFLAVTIILSPVSLLGAILLVALVLFGWVAIGLELGKRLAEAIHQDWHPAVSAGIGTFGLTLVALGLSKVMLFIGWMVPFLVSMVALGAVMLVFFGAGRIYVPSGVALQPAVVSVVVESAGPVSTPPVEMPTYSGPSSEEIPPAP